MATLSLEQVTKVFANGVEGQHAGRRAALDRITEDASEAGIYGGTPEDYAAALKKARRRAARHEDGSYSVP